MISFLMPVKDEELFVEDAIRSIQVLRYQDWEIIVIDDHSSDGTAALVERIQEKDKRVKLVSNKGHGQLYALAAGFSCSKGDYIKFIDGDDLLDPVFSEKVPVLMQNKATYHDLEIVSRQVEKINIFRLTSKFRDASFQTCLKFLLALPRAAWFISRDIAEKVFSVPAELSPFCDADSWIALIIKKYADIRYLNQSLYLYRQHPGQDYGGHYNYSRDVVIARAKAKLEITDFLLSHENENPLGSQEMRRELEKQRNFFLLMAGDRVFLSEVLKSEMSVSQKCKLVMIRKMPGLTSSIVRLKSQLNLSLLR